MATQLTEKPAGYEEKFRLIKKQMMKSSKIKRKFKESEVEVMIKNSLIVEAEDKIAFMLRTNLRRMAHKKREMTEDEYSSYFSKLMKEKLIEQGFPFKLEKEEKEALQAIQTRMQEESVKEISDIATEAMRKILSTK